MFLYAIVLALQQPDLLAKVRDAVAVAGGKPWAETLMTGKASFYGEPATYSLRFTRDGRFLQEMKSRLGEAYGYDGKRFWETDYSGAGHELRFEDADVQLATMLLVTDRWLEPGAPVDLTVDGTKVHVKLRSSSFEEIVEIDTDTMLPVAATFFNAVGKGTILLSGWQAAGAKKLPFRVVIVSGGLTDIFTVEKATEIRDPGPASFAIPKWKATDTAFDPTKPVEIESKKAFTGHMLVHPLVNGKDVGWFILDSGAEVMVIDPKVADSLSLEKLGEEQLVGVGGIAKSSFRYATDFELGPMKFHNVKFAEFSLSQIGGIFHVKLAGIVGYDVFRRAVIGLDLKSPTVTVSDPETYRLPSASWTSIQFDSGNPVVEARFEGDRKGQFRLDSGANGAVTFHAPYVEKEHLLAGRSTRPVMTGGVGGMTASKMGTLKWFELGGHRFDNVEAVFSESKTGAFADRYLTGNIGQDLMLPFTVVFDFGSSRVAFLPHAKKK